MMSLKLLFSLLALALLMCGLVLSAAAQDESRSAWTWQRSDDGWRREVKVIGRAEFREDYTDVQSLTEGSSLRVEERRSGQDTQRYEVRRGADGQLQRTYTVNGQPRAFDAEAQHWLAALLLVAVRQGGLDARTRVARLLRQRGPDGVLAEVAEIEGDYAKRIYYDELLKETSLSAGVRQKALRAAARDMRSDYERAQLLLHAADNFLRTDALVPTYFEAVDQIGSDYERRRVLTAVLHNATLSQTARRRLLQSAAAISSDYEKATLLITAAPAYTNDISLRAAFDVTVNTINSDHERGRVLKAVARRTND